MTKSVTIAVVDDDDSVRRSLRQLLRAADFKTLTYASAEEYLGRGEQVDCLIVDVNLPGMNGVELLQRLAASRSAPPAVLITARDDPGTLDLIGRVGSIPHLRKPFSGEQLFEAISRVLS